MDCPLEQLVKAVARRMQAMRRLVGTANLVQNLVLTHRYRIEPRTHVHHMVRHVVARLEVKELRKILEPLSRKLAHVLHEFRLGNFPVRSHVDFGTVARRKNQEFVKRRMAERFRLHIHRDVELFADCDFGHLVAHACHVDFAHESKIEKEIPAQRQGQPITAVAAKNYTASSIRNHWHVP